MVLNGKRKVHLFTWHVISLMSTNLTIS